MTFEESLSELKHNVGQRNGMLMAVAMRGINEGNSPDEVADIIARTDCGDPPLTPQEIARAVGRSKEYLSGEPNTGKRFEVAMKRIRKELEGTSPEERSFVRRMIDIGAKAAEARGIQSNALLLDLSPVKFKGLGSPYGSIPLRRAMAKAYIKARFPDENERIFATDNIKAERDDSRIFSPSGLMQMLDNSDGDNEHNWPFNQEQCNRHNASPFVNNVISMSPLRLANPSKRDVPTHICVNPVTGLSVKKNGKSSFANKQTVSAYHYALVEFDGIGTPYTTVGEQSKFWCGVILSKSLDVVTLTYTVNKSIHGIVRLKEMTVGDDLFGNVSHEAAEQQFKRQTDKLARILCSDPDVAFRCDRNALIDSARMTRFPGGLRDHGLPHLLVWCKAS